MISPYTTTTATVHREMKLKEGLTRQPHLVYPKVLQKGLRMISHQFAMDQSGGQISFFTVLQTFFSCSAYFMGEPGNVHLWHGEYCLTTVCPKMKS